ADPGRRRPGTNRLRDLAAGGRMVGEAGPARSTPLRSRGRGPAAGRDGADRLVSSEPAEHQHRPSDPDDVALHLPSRPEPASTLEMIRQGAAPGGARAAHLDIDDVCLPGG